MYRITALSFASGIIAASGSLIAYYPLDGNFADASGNGNDGVMLGGVSYGGGAGAPRLHRVGGVPRRLA